MQKIAEACFTHIEDPSHQPAAYQAQANKVETLITTLTGNPYCTSALAALGDNCWDNYRAIFTVASYFRANSPNGRAIGNYYQIANNISKIIRVIQRSWGVGQVAPILFDFTDLENTIARNPGGKAKRIARNVSGKICNFLTKQGVQNPYALTGNQSQNKNDIVSAIAEFAAIAGGSHNLTQQIDNAFVALRSDNNLRDRLTTLHTWSCNMTIRNFSTDDGFANVSSDGVQLLIKFIAIL